MLWVELWTPVAAILNLFIGTIAVTKFHRAFDQDGLNPGSSLNILSDSAMLASVGGYLYASVPALTWLVLKGSGQMLGSITGGMAGGYASNLAAANINKDAQLTSKREAFNDWNASKTGKFLNMAEIESNQAKAQGWMDGSKLGKEYEKGGGWGGVNSLMIGAGSDAANQTISASKRGELISSHDADASGVSDALNAKTTTAMVQKARYRKC